MRRPLRRQRLWVLFPLLEALERIPFLPPLPGAQVKTSDPLGPRDDDIAVACSFLKALLGGCSSGGGGGGGSMSAHFGLLHLGGCDVGGARLVEQRHCCLRHQALDAPGETLDLGLPGSDDDGVLSPSLLGASFWSKCWLEEWWSGASSHTLMAADIGGMALWGLGVRCVEMGSRRRR